MVTAPRLATSTVKFIDDYCQNYEHLFSDVRNYEALKLLHLGLLSELPHKSLPLIARAVGLSHSQSLHHFLKDSLWESKSLRQIRFSIHANNFQILADKPVESQPENSTSQSGLILQFQQHPWWEDGTTWKSALNNLRLMIQPYIFYCLISPWLTVFKIPGLRRKFYDLIYCMDDFPAIYTPFPATSSLAA